MRILMISAEAPPLRRAGALVDVLNALPRELRGRGHEVAVARGVANPALARCGGGALAAVPARASPAVFDRAYDPSPGRAGRFLGPRFSANKSARAVLYPSRRRVLRPNEFPEGGHSLCRQD